MTAEAARRVTQAEAATAEAEAVIAALPERSGHVKITCKSCRRLHSVVTWDHWKQWGTITVKTGYCHNHGGGGSNSPDAKGSHVKLGCSHAGCDEVYNTVDKREWFSPGDIAVSKGFCCGCYQG